MSSKNEELREERLYKILSKERIEEIVKENFPEGKKLTKIDMMKLAKIVIKEETEKLYSQGHSIEEIARILCRQERFVKRDLGIIDKGEKNNKNEEKKCWDDSSNDRKDRKLYLEKENKVGKIKT